MIPADRHLSSDELAELALGAFDDAEAAAVRAHMAGCARCTQLFGRLGGLPELLATIRYPPIPGRASQRIETILAVEARQRAAVAGGHGPSRRREGVVGSPVSLCLSDHLCWAYRGRAEWTDRAVEYSADAIAAGQRARIVGDASTAELRTELAEMVSSMHAGRAAGALPAGVGDLSDHVKFASDGSVDQDATFAARQSAVDDALAAGYNGLRIVVDVTALVRTEAHRDTAARLEYLGDRKVSSLPLCSMCCYDVDDLGPDAVAEMACMHPFTNPGAAPFRLYTEHGADFGLAGTIDDATAGALFRRALERTDPPAGKALIVDARQAELIGYRAFAELNAHSARMGRVAVMHMKESLSPSPETLSSFTNLMVDIDGIS
jgi:hypothetical protein